MSVEMSSRGCILAAIRHEPPDRVPVWCQCYGFTAPPHLRWQRDGREVTHWYSMRLEQEQEEPR